MFNFLGDQSQRGLLGMYHPQQMGQQQPMGQPQPGQQPGLLSHAFPQQQPSELLGGDSMPNAPQTFPQMGKPAAPGGFVNQFMQRNGSWVAPQMGGGMGGGGMGHMGGGQGGGMSPETMQMLMQFLGA